MPQTSHSKPYSDQGILNELAEMTCDRMEDYLEYFGISLKQYGKRYMGRCPVHGSRSHNSVNLYPEGSHVRGYWECHTNRCENVFPKTVIGFTRGIMSHDAYGWGSRGDKTVGHREAVDELCKFHNISLNEVKVDYKKVQRRKMLRNAEILTPTGRPSSEYLTQAEFQASHEIPSPYYLDRGYEQGTLKTFSVGQNYDTGRTNIPIFDPFGKLVLGVLSRSPWEECDHCKFNHGPKDQCHQDGDLVRPVLRWDVQPEGFVDKQHLYGFWKSRDLIIRSKSVVLVEGASDVWRLWEAGVQNAVGIMGSKFTDAQSILLEECSPRHIILMTDNDEAGNRVADEISRGVWRRLARIHRMTPTQKDIGAMTAQEVEDQFRRHITLLMK